MLEGLGRAGSCRGEEGGGLCSAAGPPPISAPCPCAPPKKAEQDIELWKKQEAAAKEAESGPPGSEDRPEVKVPHVSPCPGGEGPSRSGAGGEPGGQTAHPVLSPTAAAHPEGQAAADGHDRRAEEEADGEGAAHLRRKRRGHRGHYFR